MIDFLSRSQQDANTGCWLWEGALDDSGYGRVNVGGKNRKAHRVAWTQANGEIPGRMFVCHRCDMPACVNIDHLWIGTNADNMRDMARKGRGNTPRGPLNNMTKLTEEDVIAVRNSSLTHAQEARRLGVTNKAIAFIRQRVNWKHVP